MSRHTPGPWTASAVSSVVGSLITHGDINVAAAMSQSDKTVCEANARLIAAAPDLLTACKRAFDLLGHLEYFDADERSAVLIQLDRTLMAAELSKL